MHLLRTWLQCTVGIYLILEGGCNSLTAGFQLSTLPYNQKKKAKKEKKTTFPVTSVSLLYSVCIRPR